PHIIATYKAGKLYGSYTEYNENGSKKLVANYKDGKLNGTVSQFENGKLFLTQTFKDGELVTARSAAQIKKKLAEIDPEHKGRYANDTAEREAALRRLKAYRYLAGVPYENLALDSEMNSACLAGAKLLEKLGKLDHTPPNPGLPEADYQLGYKGTSHSNIAMGLGDLAKCVDGWMDDSDRGNIDRLGHRRWCINPAMQKTGFGRSGKYACMWSFDNSQKQMPDYDFVAWPPKGLLPVEYFGGKEAWSVSFNTTKYKVNASAVKANIYKTDASMAKGAALKMDFFHVDNGGYGIPNCVIFRPEGADVAPGKRYLVEIEGVAATPVRYMVEFMKAD
ncbi:MAG TPA: CAP domain-containing protein, partial [Gemmataceae bacterium]|nr:CAP domain-containing protein [Gemmataceae bacterium]